MWQRFTESSRRIILSAQHTCDTAAHQFVGNEHLLVALFDAEDSPLRLLAGVSDAELEKSRAALSRELYELPRWEERGEARLNPEAKRTLEYAAREARRLRHSAIEPRHLLLALMREKNGIAPRVLQKNYEEVKTAVLRPSDEELSTQEPPSEQPASWWNDLWRKRP